jgi:hypothetical protein
MAGFFLSFGKRGLANGCLGFAAGLNGYLTSERVMGWNSHDGMDFIDIYYMCYAAHPYA